MGHIQTVYFRALQTTGKDTHFRAIQNSKTSAYFKGCLSPAFFIKSSFEHKANVKRAERDKYLIFAFSIPPNLPPKGMFPNLIFGEIYK